VFGQQQLANLAWALAVLGYWHPPLFDAIAAAAIAKRCQIGPQGLANIAWSCSKLGVRNRPLMEAIAAESLAKIRAFDAQNLSNTAWAYAKLGVAHEPLMHAIASSAIHKLPQLAPRELSGLSWSFATLWIPDAPLLDAIAAAARAKISAFDPLDVANTAWAFDRLRLLDSPLRNSIASASLKSIPDLGCQPLATLVDLALPSCGALEERLSALVASFAKQWLALDPFTGMDALLLDWQVDNFGIVGTANLLARLGVRSPEGREFGSRAAERVDLEARGRGEEWRRRRFFFKARVHCYAEFDFAAPAAAGARLRGSVLKENSFMGEGTRAGRAGLLRGAVLPISDLVDRTLCAEFQVLSDIGDLLDSAGAQGWPGRRSVTGRLQLWTSGASCLSCVGAMRQFLSLFPGVRLEVICAARPR